MIEDSFSLPQVCRHYSWEYIQYNWSIFLTSVKVPWTKLLMRAVFPTLESPKTTTVTEVLLSSFCFVIFVIFSLLLLKAKLNWNRKFETVTVLSLFMFLPLAKISFLVISLAFSQSRFAFFLFLTRSRRWETFIIANYFDVDSFFARFQERIPEFLSAGPSSSASSFPSLFFSSSFSSLLPNLIHVHTIKIRE